MSKRGHGEGTIFQKPNGRWVAQVSAGFSPDGKRKRLKRTARTKTDAQRLLRELQRQVEDGLITTRADMTVDELLTHFEKTVLAGKELSQNTIDGHRWALDKHLRPGLGKAKLRNLTVSDVENFLQGAAKDHDLSKSSLNRLRATLARAIKEAQRREWVHRNVAELAHTPPGQVKTRRSLSSEEISLLLDTAVRHRFEALLKLAITRGLRPGELLGLRWQDLNLDGNPPTVAIRKSLKRAGTTLTLGDLKTTSSNRELVLPDLIVRDLRRHKSTQAKQRLRVGDMWQDLDLVFANEIGGLVDPANLRRALVNLCDEAGIERVTPYELRHTAVSHLSDVGVPIEQLADLAGHKDARTTMAVYRHQLSKVVDAGADVSADILKSRPAEA